MVPEEAHLFAPAAWFALASVARAEVPPTAYDRAVELIGSLYLKPDDVDAVALLRAAGDGLSDDLDWLVVAPVERGVALTHGNGRPIGTVTVGALDALPDALRALELSVTDSGFDAGDLDVRLSLLEGMCGALDRYSSVLAGDRAARFDVRLKGTTVGVGIELDPTDGDAMRIVRVLRGSPADAAGVLVGDVLLRLDGRSTTGLGNTEARKLVGGEEGTAVAFTLSRAGAALELTLTRAEVVVPNVESRVLPGGIGYVAISHVSQRTVQNLLVEMDTLRGLGALGTGLVVDLRGNTGGSMKESAYLADQFVETGLLLETAGRNGSPVPNLQRRMEAVDSGTEPEIPIALLVDERTASGAEILAGSLLELHRAVLVGSRTYGKGWVQKVFDLDEGGDTELKLTVAEYVLANERHIRDEGIVPDVTVGEIELDASGVRYRDWDPWAEGVSWDEIVPAVTEHAPWRGIEDGERDVALEIARRTVASAKGDTREAGLAALGPAVSAVRAEEERRLVAALGAKGIDWSPAAADAGIPDAEVRLSATAPKNDSLTVTASVENMGSTPLHRALVELSGPSVWSGLVLPVGHVAPGQTASGSLSVKLPAGVDLREDDVGMRLRADRRPPLPAGDAVLRHSGTPEPTVQIRARLVPVTDGVARAEITVRNLSRTTITGLAARFAYPKDGSIELTDASASADRLGPLESHRFDLQLRVGADAPGTLPLEVVVESERFGDLLQWPLPLPRDGSEVFLEAPAISLVVPALSAPVGSLELPIVVSDDHGLDHVVVWTNGAKTQWIGGGTNQVGFEARVQILSGVNRVTVVATDDQGLAGRRTFVVRGVEDTSVDASP